MKSTGKAILNYWPTDYCGFSCGNNPIAVGGFGANFCGNVPDGRESR